MAKCMNCKSIIDDEYKSCPYCAVPIAKGETWPSFQEKIMLLLGVALTLLVVTAISLSTSDDSADRNMRELNPSEREERRTPDFSAIRYELLSDERMPAHTKRTVSLLLEDRITESEINALADYYYNMTAGQYGHTYVRFYLEGRNKHFGTWAIVGWNPERYLVQNGFRPDEYQQSVDLILRHRDTMLRMWRDDRAIAIGALVLEDNKLKIIESFRYAHAVFPVLEINPNKTLYKFKEDTGELITLRIEDDAMWISSSWGTYQLEIIPFQNLAASTQQISTQ